MLMIYKRFPLALVFGMTLTSIVILHNTKLNFLSGYDFHFSFLLKIMDMAVLDWSEKFQLGSRIVIKIIINVYKHALIKVQFPIKDYSLKFKVLLPTAIINQLNLINDPSAV